MYQLLAHAVTPVPSFADIRQTERGRYFSHVDHAYVSPTMIPSERAMNHC
jgi:hypothetical protein